MAGEGGDGSFRRAEVERNGVYRTYPGANVD